MNKLILVFFGVLFATATARQFATNFYQNDFTNAAAAQYSAGEQLAFSNVAAAPVVGYPFLGYPYDLGLWGGLGAWGSPIVATDLYANSFENAAAAQFSSGNTVAASNFAAPLGVWGFPYFKRRY